MSGPWEDYQPSQPSVERGPWEDYGGASPIEPVPQEEKGFFASIPSQMLKSTPFGMAADMYERGGRGELLTPKEESQLRGLGMGASNLATGGVQYAANALGMGDGINDAIQRKEAEYQAGREASGREGFDAMRIAGNVIDPVAVLGMKGMGEVAPATTTWERIRQGAGAGGAIGLMSPVTSGDDFEAEKNRQAGAGMTIGGAIPAALAAGGGIYNTLKNLISPSMGKGGTQRAALKVINDVLGERRAPVVERLGQAEAGETAAQAAAPAGSAEFAGLQRIAAKNAPSEFRDIRLAEESRIGKMWEDLNKKLWPIGKGELDAANLSSKTGGPVLASQKITDSIDEILSTPGKRASKVVQATLNDLKERINTHSKDGVLDAHDLYTIRKEIGNSIKTYAKENQNWDKRLTSGLEKSIQGTIDDAVEKAGGGRWKEYLTKYSEGADKINARVLRSEDARKMGAEGLSKAAKITKMDEAPGTLPNPLHRGVMVANAVIRRLEGYGGQKTTDEISRLMANPQELYRLMKAATPQERMVLAKEFMRNTAISTSAQAAGRGIGSN